MTILDALRTAEDRLRDAQAQVRRDVEQNAKLDAQVLLAHVLGKGTAYLFAHGEDPLLPHYEETFFALLDRRLRHEPVAYILGKKEFYGREFLVTRNVLIPRPDTEVLVDAAKHVITNESLIIDIGTGSGAIALTLGLDSRRPVVGIDNSATALAVAQENARRLAAKNVIFLEGHLLTPLITESAGESMGEHLVITANLPYIATAQYDTLDPDVKHYEPAEALVSGPEGLDHYDALLAQIAKWRNLLPRRLDLFMEIDPSQKHTLPRHVNAAFPAARVEVIDDMARKARVVHMHLE